MARRNFNSTIQKRDSATITKKTGGAGLVVGKTTGQSTSLSNIKPKAENKKISEDGLKPVSTLKKESRSGVVTKSSPESRPSARIIRQGQMPRPKQQPSKPVSKPVAKKPVVKEPPKRTVLNHRRVKSGVPTVGKLPRGSRERKVAEQLDEGPFWHRVKRKYFR